MSIETRIACDGRGARHVWDAIQQRLRALPEGMRVDSPTCCSRILREIRLGFREVFGEDGHPCQCGGILRPHIANRTVFPWHKIDIDLRCDGDNCDVRIVPEWKQSQCPSCSAWMDSVDPAKWPEWACGADELLWCRECKQYVSVLADEQCNYRRDLTSEHKTDLPRGG